MEAYELPTNWMTMFVDLEKCENELSDAINSFIKCSETNFFVKSDIKSDDWRNLHNLISKNGKAFEKVLNELLGSLQLFTIDLSGI